MRTALLLLLALAVSSTVYAHSQFSGHVRAMSREASNVLRLATERSQTVRELVDALEETDVVVLLTVGEDSSPDGTFGYMRLISATSEARFVVVHLYATPVPPILYVPRLGHELQHALELGNNPRIRDARGCEHLYQMIGFPVGAPGAYETDLARSTEHRVMAEIETKRQAYQ